MNNFAISSGEIGEALSRSSSALATANNDLDESIGLIVGANDVLQDAKTAGTALKTVSLRIRGADTELKDLGEDTEGMAESTAKLQQFMKATAGVDIMKDNKTFKSTTEILRELAAVWKDLDDIDQAAILEKLAGKTRANALASVLNNWDDVEAAIKDSQNASEGIGSATEENNRHLDSMQGKLDQLTDTWQKLWATSIDSDVLKFFIDLGNDVLKLIDSLGGLGTVLGAVSADFVAINFPKIIAWFKAIPESIAPATNALKAFFTGKWTAKNISSLQDQVNQFTKTGANTAETGTQTAQTGATVADTAAQQAQNAEHEKATEIAGAEAAAETAETGTQTAQTGATVADTAAQQAANAVKKDGIASSEEQAVVEGTVTGEKIAGAAATATGTVAEKAGTVATKQRTVAENELTAALNARKIAMGVLVAGITIAIAAIGHYVQAQKEAAQEAAQAREEAINTGKTASDSYKQLQDAVDKYKKVNSDSSSSESDVQSAVENVTSALGDKANVLEGLTQGTKDYTDALDQQVEAEKRAARVDLRTAYNAAKEELQNNGTGVKNENGNKEVEALSFGLDEYSLPSLSTVPEGVRKKVLEDLAPNIRGQQIDGNGAFRVYDDIDSQISGIASLKKAQEDLDDELTKYQDVLQQAKEEQSETTEGTDEYQKAVEKVTEAQKNYNSINDLFESFEVPDDLQKEVSDAIEAAINFDELEFGDVTSDNFKQFAEEVADSLNVTSQSSIDYITEQVKDYFNIVEDAADSAGDAYINFTKDIDTAVVSMDDMVNQAKNMQTALNDSASATGLLSSDIDNVTKAFQGLSSFNPTLLFENTANGVHINRDEYNKLASELRDNTFTQFGSTLDDLSEAYDKCTKKIEEMRAAGEDASAYEAQLSNIRVQIDSLQQLQSQYEGITSAYKRWTDSLQGTDERAGYESITSNYKNILDLIDRGWVGDESVRAFADLVTYGNQADASIEEIQKDVDHFKETISGTNYSIADFFTVDNSGNSTSQGLYNFFDAIEKKWGDTVVKINKDGKKILDLSGGKEDEVAESLGTDVELLEQLLKSFYDAGGSVQLDTDSPIYTQVTMPVEQATAQLKVLTGTDYEVHLSSTSIQDAQDEIDNLKKDLKDHNIMDAQGHINIDVEGAQAAEVVLQQMVDRLVALQENNDFIFHVSVDEGTPNSLEKTIGLLQDAQDAIYTYNDTKKNNPDVDLSGLESNVVDAVNALKDSPDIQDALKKLDIEIPANFKIQNADELSKQISGIDTIKYEKAGGDLSKVQGYDQDTKTFNIDGKMTDRLQKIITKVENVKGNVSLDITQSSIRSFNNKLNKAIKNKTIKVTLDLQTKEAKSKSSSKDGDDKSPKGTNHGSSSKGSSNNSKSSSKTGHDDLGGGRTTGRKTLVGEEGQEMYVSRKDGTYHTVGDNGPEFIQTQPGDLIFNHQQTEDLLNKGHTGTRGKALVNGNLKKYKNYKWLYSHDEKWLRIAAQEAYDDAVKDGYKEYIGKNVYGNIDVSNRQALNWDKANQKKYGMSGQGYEDGDYSTILGSDGDYGKFHIAFSPMLQTNGKDPILLDWDTVDEYLSYMAENSANVKELLANDAEGALWDTPTLKGIDIHGLIASAALTSDKKGVERVTKDSMGMHYAGAYDDIINVLELKKQEKEEAKKKASKKKKVSNKKKAHISGNNGLPHDEKNSLVGERGEELAYNPNTGEYQMLGQDGPEMVDLDKGTVIYNADQTKKIVSGNAYEKGNAHDPTSRSAQASLPGYKPKSNSKPIDEYASEQLAKQQEKAAKDTSKAAKDVSNTTTKTIDWFERRTSIYEEQIEYLSAIKDNTKGSAAKNPIIDKQIDLYNQEIGDYTKAIGMYTDKANEILAKLPASLRDKAVAGDVSIEDIKEASKSRGADKDDEDEKTTSELVEEYEQWADKVYEVQTAIQTLQKTIREAELEKFNNIVTDYTNRLNVLSTAIDYVSSKIDRFETAGNIIGESWYQLQAEEATKQIQTYSTELSTLQAQLADFEANHPEDIGSDEWWEMNNSVIELYGNIENAKKAVVEYSQAMEEVPTKVFDAINNSLEAQLSMLQAGLGIVNGATGKNKIINAENGLYQQQYSQNQNLLDYYQGKANDIYNNLPEEYRKMIDSGQSFNVTLDESNSELATNINKWNEWQTKADGVRTTMYNLQQSMQQLELDKFNNIQTQYENEISARGTIADLMSQDIDSFTGGSVVLSDSAVKAQSEQYEKRVQLYKDEIKDLQEQMDKAVDSGAIKKGSDAWWEMYNAILSAKSGLKDATKNLKEFNEESKNVQLQIFEKVGDIIGRESSMLEAALDTLSGSASKNQLTNVLQDLDDKQMEWYEKQRSYYQNLADESLGKLSPDIRSQIEANPNIDISTLETSNEEEAEALDNLEKAQKGLDETNTSMYQMKKTLADLEVNKFDNVVQDFEDISDLRDDFSQIFESLQSLAEASGEKVGRGLYQGQLEQEEAKLANTTASLTAAQNQLNDAVASGRVKEGDDNWLKMVNTINDLQNSSIQSEASIEKLKLAITDVDFNNFKDAMSDVENLESELSSLADLFDQDDAVDNDTAEWTKNGIAQLGMQAQAYELNRKQVDDYRKAMADLTDKYNSGEYTVTEYNERLQELITGQYNSAKAAKSAKDAIVSLYKVQVNKEIDVIEKQTKAYKDLIDAENEALQAEKDLHDYRKSITEDTKNITDIQRQLAALANDDSNSARAQRAKLQDQLNTAQNDLGEDEYDHSISAQEDALDKQLDQYQKQRDAETEALQKSLLDREALVQQAFELVKQNAVSVGAEIQSVADQYGITVSQSLTDPWQQGQNAIASYGEVLTPATSAFVGQIQQVENQTYSAQAAADSACQHYVEFFATRSDDLVAQLESTRSKTDEVDQAVQLLHKNIITMYSPEGGYDTTGFDEAMEDIKNQTDDANKVIENLHGTISATLESGYDTSNILNALQGIIDKADAAAAAVNSVNSSGGGSGSGGNDSDWIKKYNQNVNDWSNKKISDAEFDKRQGDLNKSNNRHPGYSEEEWTRKTKSDQDVLSGKISADEYKRQQDKINQDALKRIRGHASGARKLSKNELAWTQEFGDEAILSPTRNAILTPLKAGDSVLTAAQTENLYNWAKMSPTMFSNVGGSAIQPVSNKNISSEMNIQSLVTVNGNIDNTNIKRMEQVAKDAINSAFKQFSQGIHK